MENYNGGEKMKLEVTIEYEYEVEISEEEKAIVIEKLNGDYIKSLESEFNNMFLSGDGRKEDSNLQLKFSVEA